MRHLSLRLGVAGFLTSGLIAGGATARACTIDLKPTALADGVLARPNQQQPTSAAQLAVWTPFVFPRSYKTHAPVTLTEDRRKLARVLVPAALRRPWRWTFTDGTSHAADQTVIYGWTIRHTFAHPGQWRAAVAAYDTDTRQWYPLDQLALRVQG